MSQTNPPADPTLVSLPTTHSSSSSVSLRLSGSYISNKHCLCLDPMRRRLRANLFLTFAAIALFLFFYLQLPRHAFSSYNHHDLNFLFFSAANNLRWTKFDHYYNLAIHEDSDLLSNHHHVRRVSSFKDSSTSAAASVSVLLADWEILVIVSDPVLLPRSAADDDFLCVFQNNATSAARFSGILPMNNRKTYKCTMPISVRRLQPFLMPVLKKTSMEKEEEESLQPVQMPELHRGDFLVYESVSTEDDVVLFVKGINNRQGNNRSPSEFNCIFFYDDDSNVAAKTVVSSSAQEVFRCAHPKLTAFGSESDRPIKVSLETLDGKVIVPSVAQYLPRYSVANPQPKSLLCASTMVYNVGKFLKEWVTYHSKIGVDKFTLYDNDSNDNLSSVVEELNGDGYDVTILFWVWPKAQEAGFSHSAIYGSDSCTWMMYVDVDEFVFSPSWTTSNKPSNDMLKSLLPRAPHPRPSSKPSDHSIIGQVSIKCNDFGPSNQRAHPTAGVTQGYTCRRMLKQRHKSILLLEAVDHSLLNVVHHFRLGSDYKTKPLGMEKAVVNHYKYQAWSEFRNKFRRRVSTYVADWKQKVNLGSKDRTPGLGFEPVEPKGWPQMFCEVRDERLKLLTQRWFGSPTSDGYKMAWEI